MASSALLMRRRDLISGLYLGALPQQTLQHRGAGPDHFVKLFATLSYKSFVIVNESLVHFGLHDGSITAQSANQQQSHENLQGVYREIWTYYHSQILFK
jgi:hypothetical protein